jgi:threonine aldolase
VIERAKASGILLGAAGAKRIRAVTHLDVDRDGVLHAARAIVEIVATS